MGKKILTALAAAAGSGVLMTGVAFGQALPTTADFTFKTKSGGGFHARVIYDQPVPLGCTAYLLARSEIGGPIVSDVIEIDRVTILKRGTNKLVWNQENLPRVVQTQQGAVPIAHMMVRTRCAGQVLVDSNVMARYIRCGRPNDVTGLKKKRVRINRWLSYLHELFLNKDGVESAE